MCHSCGDWWWIAAFKQVTLVCAGTHWWCWWPWLCAATEEEFPCAGKGWEQLLCLMSQLFMLVLALGLQGSPLLCPVCGLHRLAPLCHSLGASRLAKIHCNLSYIPMFYSSLWTKSGPSWALPQDLPHTTSIPVFGGWISLQPTCGVFKFKTFLFCCKFHMAQLHC